jgi:hypothetical protein
MFSRQLFCAWNSQPTFVINLKAAKPIGLTPEVGAVPGG